MFICALAAAARAPAGPPRVPIDLQVDQAVRSGVDYLLKRPHPGGKWSAGPAARYPGEVEALVCLAVLSSDEQTGPKRLSDVLSYLGEAEPSTVYARALRAMVYARLPRETYGERLDADVQWLIAQQRDGGWGYGPGHPTTEIRKDWTDNRNSQSALLALADAAAAGAAVPDALWARCAAYWSAGRNADGGWGFEPPGRSSPPLRPDSYGSMTAVGVASLCLLSGAPALEPTTGPATQPEEPRRPAPSPHRQAIAEGMKWLEDRYSVEAVPGWVHGEGDEWLYYYLYALGRALNGAGVRTFAGRDWCADMAGRLVADQQADGSWAVPSGGGEPSDPLIRTCFALLSLAELRAPVLINRLSLSGRWDHDPRDAANLARWFGVRFGRGGGWQMLTPADLPLAMKEAPILYVNEGGDTKFPDSLKDPLRRFIRDGGTVLVQPFSGDAKFYGYARGFFRRLLPGLSERRLHVRSDVFRTHFPIATDKLPKGVVLSDTLRGRVFILSSDLSGAWGRNLVRERLEAFQFGANLVFYTTDRRPWAGRLALRRPDRLPPDPDRWIAIARVRHRGDWNVCPRTVERLSRTLTEALSIGVREVPPVDLSEDVPSDVRLLWLTGTGSIDFKPEQIARLKRYLEDGGMLFIDQAAGKGRLFIKARAMLQKTFGPERVKRIPNNSPLLSGAFAGGIGSDVRRVAYTYTIAARQPRLRTPLLWGVEQDGRLAVVLSPYAVTCPVEGMPVYGLQGLLTDDARRLAGNIVLYAALER